MPTSEPAVRVNLDRTILLVLAALATWALAGVLMLAFGAALAAIFLRTLSEWVSRGTGLSRGWSLAVVLVVLTAMTVAATHSMGGSMTRQAVELSEQIPKSVEKLRNQLRESTWGKPLEEAAPDSLEEVPVSGRQVAAYSSAAFTSATGAVAGFVVVLFLAIYFAYDSRPYVEGALGLLPPARRPATAEALNETGAVLRWWLIGKIVSMFIIGVLTTIGLMALGVPLPGALGVIAALLTFIPNIGPVIAAIPAVLLGLAESPVTGLYVVILYVVIQTVESYLITPLIQQKTVSLPPALVILAQIAMGVLAGLPGVVLATPLAAMSLVLVKRLYIEPRDANST